jgi:hypothetical protein
MTLSMAQFEQDRAFERFLGANVGKDHHGMEVSVLSMLARLGLDPWIEASKLAAMSHDPAHKRLDGLMARFKDVPGLMSERGKIISVLLEYLPTQKAVAKAPVQSGSDTLKMPQISATIYLIVAVAIILVWIVSFAQGQ